MDLYLKAVGVFETSLFRGEIIFCTEVSAKARTGVGRGVFFNNNIG